MNTTLFPEIPTQEQIARYKQIFALLDGYRLGSVAMEQIAAIPKQEVQEARDWVSSASFQLLEADIPEFWAEDGE